MVLKEFPSGGLSKNRGLSKRFAPLALVSLLAVSFVEMCGDTRKDIVDLGAPIDLLSKPQPTPEPTTEVDFEPGHRGKYELVANPERDLVKQKIKHVLANRNYPNKEVVQVDMQERVDELRSSMPSEVQLKWAFLQKHCDDFFSTSRIDDDVPYSLQSLEQVGVVYQSFMADLVSHGVSGSLLNASLEDACASFDDLSSHTVHLATELMGTSRVNAYEKARILADFKGVLGDLGVDYGQLDDLIGELSVTDDDYAGYVDNLVTEIKKLDCHRKSGVTASLYKLSMLLDSMTPEQLGVDQKEYDYLSGIVNPNFDVLMQDLYNKFSKAYMDYVLESQDGLNDHLNHVLGIKIQAFNALNDLINGMLLYGFSSDEIDPALDWSSLLVLREELRITPEDEECYFNGFTGFNEYIGMLF